MKKILSVFLCLLLVTALATPVFAAQTAKMTVTASKTDLKPGDKVTFTVSVTKVDDCNVGGFLFSYDESVFSYDSGKSLAGLKGFFAGVSTAAGNVAGFFMNGVGTVEGEMFSVTLQVRSDAKAGTYTVTGKPSLTADSDVECTAVGAQVTVTGGAASSGEAKPTTPKVTVPTVPAPEVGDTPVSSVTPDAEDIPESTGEPVDVTTPTEENHHVENSPEKPAFPWWILIVIGLVAAGGAVFLILEIKKTKKAD